jgi:hypothetical protein
MALPDELNLESLLISRTVLPDTETTLDELGKLIDAIDAASDQDHTTWLTVDGRRIAKIAPVDEIPAAVTAWADDVRISASEFMGLSTDRRRALLDRFYARLHGEPHGDRYPPRVAVTVQHGSEMAEHDGFAAHCHAVRADHLGVPRKTAEG